MLKIQYPIIFILFILISACNKNEEHNNATTNKIVIAHRGTTYWAPEESEAAMR